MFSDVRCAVVDHGVLDDILLTLADNYEAENGHFVSFDHSAPEDFEPLRTCLAELVAEGWLEKQEMKVYRLTSQGYLKYKPRIDALRSLGRSQQGPS